jgi:hypothetical protein
MTILDLKIKILNNKLKSYKHKILSYSSSYDLRSNNSFKSKDLGPNQNMKEKIIIIKYTSKRKKLNP